MYLFAFVGLGPVRIFFLHIPGGKSKKDLYDTILVNSLYLQADSVGKSHLFIVLGQTVQLFYADAADGVVVFAFLFCAVSVVYIIPTR